MWREDTAEYTTDNSWEMRPQNEKKIQEADQGTAGLGREDYVL